MVRKIKQALIIRIVMFVVLPQGLFLLTLLRSKSIPMQLDWIFEMEAETLLPLQSSQYGSQALDALDSYDGFAGNSTSSSSLCGGTDVSSLSDGTPYGWTGGTVQQCAGKCTADPACDAFERWSSDDACHWKTGATNETVRIDPFATTSAHSCYLRRVARVTPPAVATLISPHALETTVTCDGYCCHSLSENNRSCHYTNLYLEVNGNGQSQFWAFVVAGKETYFSDRNSLVTSSETRLKCQGPFPPSIQSTMHPWKFKPRTSACSTESMNNSESDTGFTSILAGPKLKVFGTTEQLQAYVASLAKLEKRSHVHVQFGGHSNWGHHVLEGMYAAWMATSKFGLENRTICFVRSPEQVEAMDPSSTFGGCPALSWEQLTADSTPQHWVHFDDWVFGISGAGMMHRTRHYEASLSKSGDDATSLPSLFRHRMFDRYALEQPPPRLVSNECRPSSDKNTTVLLKALIVPNKRNWGDLGALTNMINDRLRRVNLQGQLVTVVAHILDWKVHSTFRQQLELIGKTDIYISCVGTALTLQSFLPDGSVVVNVGWNDGFWDEYITAATRWLDAVYPPEIGTRRSSEVVTALVRDAATKIVLGFTIPVPQGQALSPIGKAFSAFLRSEKGERLHLWSVLNAQYQWDGSFGANDESKACYAVGGHASAAYYWACWTFNPSCHPSIDFMTKFRQDYGIYCPAKYLPSPTRVKAGRVSIKRSTVKKESL